MFEVVEVLPFQPRRVKAWLRARGIGRLEIKKRGVRQLPEEVGKLLAVPGDESATLVLARVAGSIKAIVTRRVLADEQAMESNLRVRGGRTKR